MTPRRQSLEKRDPSPRLGSKWPRAVATLGMAAFILSSVACVGLVPTLSELTKSTATPLPRRSWSVVDIEKPTATEIPSSPTPTPTPAPEIEVPDLLPTATSEEAPMITMVIVDDGSQVVNDDSDGQPADPNGKYVLVSIGEQHLYAYENGNLVFSFIASTGMGNSTRVGSFNILDKIPNAYGANWNIWMPNWMGIYWSGGLENGIHALPILPGGGRLWAGYLGTPISYGCVVLGVDDALQLYQWADIGTQVEIRW